MWGGCGKVYGVSGEVCWRVGKGCGERNGEDVGKCVEVWGPNTLLIPHISLPSPFPTSPLTSPTPHHTFLHLLSYLLPHPSFLSPHPSTFSYYPHTSPFTFSKCGEVTMRRSFCGEVTVAKLPCGEVTGNLQYEGRKVFESNNYRYLLFTFMSRMVLTFNSLCSNNKMATSFSMWLIKRKN